MKSFKLFINEQKKVTEDLDKALDNPNEKVRKAAAYDRTGTGSHLDKVFGIGKYKGQPVDTSQKVRTAAASNPNASPELIHAALNDDKEYVRVAAARNRSATEEHFDRILGTGKYEGKQSDPSSEVRRSVALTFNPNLKERHLTKMFYDPSSGVRGAAASHQNATNQQLSQALRDPDENVRKFASSNPNSR